MAAGTMKAKYWLVTAAAFAAAGVTVYTRLSAGDPPVPKVPMTAAVPANEPPRLTLPPVVSPPDEPSGVPSVVAAPPMPIPIPRLPEPPAPVVPASGVVPASAIVPALPTLPMPVAPPAPIAPVPVPPKPPATPVYPPPINGETDEPPVVPPLPVTPSPKPPVPTPAVPAPLVPMIPAPLVPPVVAPAIPVVPTPAPVVAPARPVVPLPEIAPPAPAPLPAPLPPPAPIPAPLPGPTPVLQPPVSPIPAALPQDLPVVGKFVVLAGDKLIEGAVSINNNTVVVRQGALDRPFPKSQVQFVANSRDEVYKFMLAKVPATDATARLQVARWCMFSGMREQALTEAREVQKISPGNRSAADLVRSLELSLQQFPAEDSPKMTAPGVPTFPAELKVPAPAPVPPIPPAVLDPEPDVAPEAALVFGARVQPFLANQCAECHAKSDHAGKFKLVRVNPAEAGPQATRTNLRAVAGQLKKDDPGASPLLLKSLAAHGGQKLPSTTRQAAAYQALEAWTALAVGTPLAAPVLQAPTPPVSPTAPAAPIVSQPVPPVADPVLPLPPPVSQPPVDPVPVPVPLPLPAPPVADPLLPPVPAPVAPLPKPGRPPVPAISGPAAPLVPVLPPALNPVPAPPVVPPGAGRKPEPVIPPIPPAVGTAPKAPVVPASSPPFAATVPPKPPVTGPTGGDEFDPAGFNRGN
jgi:hypothetical protein